MRSWIVVSGRVEREAGECSQGAHSAGASTITRVRGSIVNGAASARVAARGDGIRLLVAGQHGCVADAAMR